MNSRVSLQSFLDFSSFRKDWWEDGSSIYGCLGISLVILGCLHLDSVKLEIMQTPFLSGISSVLGRAVENFWIVSTKAQHKGSVQLSCSVVSDSLRPHESQHARPPCPSPSPGVHSDSRPLSWWCHPAIQPSHPLLSPSPPAPCPSQHQSLFQWVNSSHEVAKVLEFQL